MLEALGSDHGPLVWAVLIVFISLVLEDAAAILAGGLVVGDVLPVEVAALALWLGLVLGDGGLYVLGRIARHRSWVARRLATPTAQRVAGRVDRHAGAAILLARVVPGLRLPTYLGCGAFGVTRLRFALWTLAASVPWTAVLLALAIALGTAAEAAFGTLHWVSLVVAATMIVVVTLVLAWRRGTVGQQDLPV